MQRIVVLNAKGGSGKTTLATNLAACYASRGHQPALLDFDIQGSAMNWLAQRDKRQAPIHGVNAKKRDTTVTRSWQMRIPSQVNRIVIDTPSAASGPQLTEYVRQAHIIIIPVLPSPIDIHAVTNFIKEILMLGKLRTIVAANDLNQRSTRIGVVANRVQDNTRVYKPLQSFLASLNLPFVAALRDSQYYMHAFVEGQGIHELRDPRLHSLHRQWQPLLDWIEEAPHYPAHPSTTSREQFEEKYKV
jgi:chromosome partitioning protein